MTPLSVDEVSLLEFFEVEPIRAEPHIPWIYDNSTYNVGDSLRLTFGVTPFSKDVSVELNQGDNVLYKLSALGIENIRYHKEKRGESLEAIISSKESVWFRIRPQISIWQTYEGDS